MNKTKLRNWIEDVPIFRSIFFAVYRKLSGPSPEFSGSNIYWDNRYRLGGNSGDGSQGKLADFKAEVINYFVDQNNVRTVIEYGSGDGSQLSLAKYPFYIGFDVSQRALSICRDRYEKDRTKKFKLLDQYNGESAELTLSLDVLYHLIEDDAFTEHMHRLFDSSTRYVIVYSSDKLDSDEGNAPHVKHRKFSEWIEVQKPHWSLIKYVPNRYPFNGDGKVSSHSDFYIYECK